GGGEGGKVGFEGGGSAAWTHFGHAPGMDHLNAVDVLECLRHCARAGRAADHDLLEMRQLAPCRFQMFQQHEPDCWHRGGASDLVPVEQFEDRCAVELVAGQNQRGAC